MNYIYNERQSNKNPGFHSKPHYHDHYDQNPVIIKQSGAIPFAAGLATGALLTPHVNVVPYQPYPYMTYPQYPQYPPTPYSQYPQYPPIPYPQVPYQQPYPNYPY